MTGWEIAGVVFCAFLGLIIGWDFGVFGTVRAAKAGKIEGVIAASEAFRTQRRLAEIEAEYEELATAQPDPASLRQDVHLHLDADQQFELMLDILVKLSDEDYERLINRHAPEPKVISRLRGQRDLQI